MESTQRNSGGIGRFELKTVRTGMSRTQPGVAKLRLPEAKLSSS